MYVESGPRDPLWQEGHVWRRPSATHLPPTLIPYVMLHATVLAHTVQPKHLPVVRSSDPFATRCNNASHVNSSQLSNYPCEAMIMTELCSELIATVETYNYPICFYYIASLMSH